MTPTELSQRLAALDWSATSLQHQLAVACAISSLEAQEERVCGACGAPWQEGMSCGQKDNGWPFATCYPCAREPEGVVELPAFLPSRSARNYLKLVVDSPL